MIYLVKTSGYIFVCCIIVPIRATHGSTVSTRDIQVVIGNCSIRSVIEGFRVFAKKISMLPIPKFEILLDRPDHKFEPGEIVTGRLVLELNAPETIRGIKVKLHGKGKVEWTETHSISRGNNHTEYHTLYFDNDGTYIDIVHNVLMGTTNGDEVDMHAGSYIYPFEFHLPFNLPNTIDIAYGGISYSVEGIVERASELNHKTEKDLIVEAPHDLSQLPMIAVDDEQNNSFCCLCFIDMGSMKVNIFLPTSNYAIGENIEVKINVDNKSKSVNVTKVELRLEQLILCYTFAGNSRTIHKINIVTHSGPFSKMDEIVTSMEVPHVHCSNATKYCSFIDILYRLVVVIKVSGCHEGIYREYPIEIGSPRSLQSVQQGNINSASIPTVGTFSDEFRTSMNTMPILHSPRVVAAQSPTNTRDELNPVASGIPIRTYGSTSSTIAPTAAVLDNYTVGVNEK